MDENTNIGPVSMEDSRIERARKREKKKKKFITVKKKEAEKKAKADETIEAKVEK